MGGAPPPPTPAAGLQTENERGALICAYVLLALDLLGDKVLVTVETRSLVRPGAEGMEAKF